MFGAEVNLVWNVSYEQAVFNTSSGWFENNTYFYLENEDKYFIRGNDGLYFWGTDKDIIGLIELQIIDLKWYHEFIDTDSSITKEEITELKYKDLGLKGAIKPVKTKRVSLFFSEDAYAAIAFDTVTNGNFSSVVSSITFSHTVSGSNTGLIVFSTQTNASPTTASFNAVGMTAEVTSADNDIRVYSLIAPANGAHNVVISYSSGVTFCAGWDSISYTGVNQTDLVDVTAVQTAGSGTSISTNITTISANAMVVDGFFGESNSTGLASGGSQTDRLLFNDVSDACLGGTSEQAAPTTQQYTMSWSWTSSISRNHAIVALKEAVVAPPTFQQGCWYDEAVGGDWYIEASDNCYTTTTEWVIGEVFIQNQGGPGSYNLIDAGNLNAQAIHNNSTPINASPGTAINLWTPV